MVLSWCCKSTTAWIAAITLVASTTSSFSFVNCRQVFGDVRKRSTTCTQKKTKKHRVVNVEWTWLQSKGKHFSSGGSDVVVGCCIFRDVQPHLPRRHNYLSAHIVLLTFKFQVFGACVTACPDKLQHAAGAQTPAASMVAVPSFSISCFAPLKVSARWF